MTIPQHEVKPEVLKVKRSKKEKKPKEPKDIRHMFRKLLAAIDIEKIKKPWMAAKAFKLITKPDVLRAWAEGVIADKTKWQKFGNEMRPVVAVDSETVGLDTRIIMNPRLALDGTWDIEYTIKMEIAGVCLSSDGVEGLYVPINHEDQNNMDRMECAAILQWLFDQAHLVFYNAKFDREVLRETMGINFRPYPYFEDVQVLQYINDPKADLGDDHGGKGKRWMGDAGNLKALSEKVLGIEQIKGEELMKVKADFFDPVKQKVTQRVQYAPFTWVPTDIALWYAGGDAICTWLLWEKMHELAWSRRLVHRIDHEMVETLTWLERQRFLIDVPHHARTVKWHTAMLKGMEIELRELAVSQGFKERTNEDTGEVLEDDRFNPSSNPQLAKFLFEVKRYKPIKMGKILPSVDADVQEELRKQHPEDEFLKKLGKYKEYVALHPANLRYDPDDHSARIYLKQNVVAGGRLSGAGGEFEVDGGFGLNPQGVVRVEGNWWVRGNVLEPDTVPVDKVQEYTEADLHSSCFHEKDGVKKKAPGIIKNHIGQYSGYAVCLVPKCTTCATKYGILIHNGRLDANQVVNIRSMFVAPKGWTFFVIDYSNIEMRAAANISGEPEFIKEFLEGKGDFHTLTASKVFPEFNDPNTPKDVKKKLRSLAKILNFALLYGGSAYTVFENLKSEKPDITFHEAENMVKAYWLGVPVFNEWCLDPTTKILTAGLQWKLLKNLHLGEEIIGFDEHRSSKGRHRKLQPSIVERLRLIQKPCVRITTDRTSIVCSLDHQWLTRRPGKNNVWYWRKSWTRGNPRYGSLREGDLLSRLSPVWKEDKSHEAGYLQGIFDGEGCVSSRELKFTQKEGPVLTKATQLLFDRGYKLGIYPDPTGTVVTINGNLGESLHCLGSIRPERLLRKAKADLWSGVSFPNVYSDVDRIIKIEYLGVQEVISIQTSTKTLIAEGLLSHNCNNKQKIAREQMTCSTTTGRVVDFASDMEAQSIHKPTKQELENYWYHRRLTKKAEELEKAKEPDMETAAKLKAKASALWKDPESGVRNAGDYNHFTGKIQRVATNIPIQGICGDFMRIALNRIRQWAEKFLVIESVLRLYLTVHDEIDFAVKNEYAPYVVPRVSRFMKLRKYHKSMKWRVGIECDCEYGTSWDVQYHLTGDDAHKPAGWTEIPGMENYIPTEFKSETVCTLLHALASGDNVRISEAKTWLKANLHERAYSAFELGDPKNLKKTLIAALQLHEYWMTDNIPDEDEDKMETLEQYEARMGLTPADRDVMPEMGFLGAVPQTKVKRPTLRILGEEVPAEDVTITVSGTEMRVEAPKKKREAQVTQVDEDDVFGGGPRRKQQFPTDTAPGPSQLPSEPRSAPAEVVPVPDGIPELIEMDEVALRNLQKALGVGRNKVVVRCQGKIFTIPDVGLETVPKEYVKVK